MLAQTTKEISHDFRSVARLAREVGEGGLDATRKISLAHTKSDCLLLSSLGEVRFECGSQEVRHDAFRDIVDLGESILGTLEWRKPDELNSLSKLVEILHRLLHFLQTVANRVWLDQNLEDGIADGAFVEEVVYTHGVINGMARKTCGQRARQAESWIGMRWLLRCREVVAVEKMEAMRKRLLLGGPSSRNLGIAAR